MKLYNEMSKTILYCKILIVIGLLFSCSESSQEELVPEVEIRFGAAIADSRSLIEEPASMGRFSVWAWRKHQTATTKNQVFDEEVITYDANISSWTYEYPRTWHLNNTDSLCIL